MTNQKVESATVTAIKSIVTMSKGYHGAEINKRDKLANAMGFVWSDKSGKYVKGGKAILRRVDLTDEGDAAKFRALKTGFVLANSERLGARYNGYTLAEIFALDKDEKAAIKLKLCNGNKKATATKAQKAKVAAFVKAVNAALRFMPVSFALIISASCSCSSSGRSRTPQRSRSNAHSVRRASSAIISGDTNLLGILPRHV